MSTTADKIAKMNQSDIPESSTKEVETCLFCWDYQEYHPTKDWAQTKAEIIRKGFAKTFGMDIGNIPVADNPAECYHNRDTKDARILKDGSMKTYYFINSALWTIYFDFNTMWYGVCDCDVENPIEVLRLFADPDTMDFVLLRQYDNEREEMTELFCDSHNKEFTINTALEIFDAISERLETTDIDEFAKDLEKHFPEKHGNLSSNAKMDFLNSYWKFQLLYDEYCYSRKLFRNLDREWLKSLQNNFAYTEKRHSRFKPENVTNNMQFVSEDKAKFDEWKKHAEKEIGRNLIHKSFGNNIIELWK